MRQLISGQLSEADSELTEALQLSEKVASRVLDKKTDLVGPYSTTMIHTSMSLLCEVLTTGLPFNLIGCQLFKIPIDLQC